jgi:membrane protein
MASQEDHRRAAEPGRGRDADTPMDIPARGLKDVAIRLWTQLDDDHVSLVAAGVAFYSLLALFPLLTALVSIYGLVADRGDIEQHLGKLYGLLPGDVIEIMRQQLVALNTTEAPKLGLLFGASLLFSLWSANKGMTSIFEAMNIAYGERERRNFFVFNLTTLLFTFGFILFLIVSLSAIIVLPPILRYVGLDEDTHWLLSLSRWPILLAIVVTMNALVYRYGPSREKARWAWLSWGSVASALAWMLTSALFSFYASNFARFNETYGSMGAVVAVMTWIWLSAMIVIAGAELNAELEHQTARDTTTGKDAPLGARGARMADTVGPNADQTRNDPKSAAKPNALVGQAAGPGVGDGVTPHKRKRSRKERGSWLGRFAAGMLVSAIKAKTKSRRDRPLPPPAR